MRKIALTLVLLTKLSLVFGGDIINVTPHISYFIFQKASVQSTSLNFDGSSFELSNIQKNFFGNDFIVTANVDGGGLFVIKFTNNRISGFVYQLNNEFGYLFSGGSSKILAEKVDKHRLYSDDPYTLTHDEETLPTEPTPEAYTYSPNRKLPLGNNLTASALNLESRPGAPTAVYIDFDGEDISGWGYNFPTVYASNYTDDQIRKIWEVISADFIHFDVNVTTNKALYDSYPLNKKLICVYGEATGLNKVGGLSLVNIFGTGKGCLVNSKNGDKGVETGHIGSHEVGHAMGLLHDGTIWPGPSEGYYAGHADWAPIMGTSYGKTYATWSLGDYEFAGNKQDDLSIIGAHTGFASDDKPTKSKLVIGKGDTINWEENNGIIEKSSDLDTFYFEMVSSGAVKLMIGTAVKHTNLDVEIELLDEKFQVIYTQNKTLQRWASIDTILNKGTYYLNVKSGYENTPFDGFTNYSSFGYYEITGVIVGLQKEEYDIAIQSLNKFNQRCGDYIEGDVVLKNNGTKTINGGELKIFVDDILDSTITFSNSIPSNGTFTISSIKISKQGSHQLKVKYVAPNSVSETITSNNESTLNYLIEEGDLFKFTTNLPDYNLTSPFTWNITKNSNIVQDGSSIGSETNNNIISQEFCLNESCYEFTLTGDFNLCTDYGAHIQGATYNGGDIVSYNGSVYKAKWWTQSLPTNASWEKIGVCNSGLFYARLNNEYTNQLISETYSNNFYTGQTEDSVCVKKLATGVSEQVVKNIVSVYPNPVKDQFTISSSNPIGFVQLFDVQGNLVWSRYFQESEVQISASDLSKGIYILKCLNSSRSIRLVR